MFRSFVVATFALSVALVPAERAEADLGEVIGGAIIGGAIIGALNQRGQQPSRGTTSSRPSCGFQCQQNREAQAALNYFGYNAGGVDGAWGPNSRRAATAFETEMGFFADGTLTDAERQFLVGSYNRAQSGFVGPHQTALNTGGPRGLLRSFNDERLGTFQPPGVAQPRVVPETGGGIRAFDPTPAVTSMASYCNETQQLSIAAGGQINRVSPQNASQALSEQFCLSRDFATRQGNQIVSNLQGVTSADVQNICTGLADSLAATIAAMPNQTREQTLNSVRQTASDIGPDRMIATGQICLSVGYDMDRGDIATAGALLAAAAGQPSYSEVIAHHLRGGFGVPANPNLARDWYMGALAEFDAGAPATILPNQAAQRNAILRDANQAAGTTTPLPTTVVQPGQSTLPTFNLGGDN